MTMSDEGHGAEAEGPLGDDLDALFAEQLRPVETAMQRERPRVRRLRADAPATAPGLEAEIAVRQWGTLPGRLSPARFSLRARGETVLHELVAGCGLVWGLEITPSGCVAWRLQSGADGVAEGARASLPAELSPVSVALGADGSLYLGDAWRGAFRLSKEGERFVALPMRDGADAPVGALRVSGDGTGRLAAVDGVGHGYELSKRGLTMRFTLSDARVEALGWAEDLTLLLHSEQDERVWLRRLSESGPEDVDLGPWRSEAAGRCALVAGPTGALALGVAPAPLWLPTRGRAMERLQDLEQLHAGAFLELEGEAALVYALRAVGRDVLCVRQGRVDSVVLDLSEELELASSVAPQPRFVHAIASETTLHPKDDARAWLATDAGLFELRFARESS